ncbi:MAG: DUF58 domain-containing protein, partial [Chitinophagia bacterium]|nr:DUF58 domain-containing protein [Chitinophagia bacterium]
IKLLSLKFIRQYIGNLFLTNLLFVVLGGLIALYFTAAFLPKLYPFCQWALLATLAAFLLNYLLLFAGRESVSGERRVDARVSIGQQQEIVAVLHNHYFFPVWVQLYDELPVQLQVREQRLKVLVPPFSTREVTYHFTPLTRGEYHFGRLIAYVSLPVSLAERRVYLAEELLIKVYPDFQQLRKIDFDMMATNSAPTTGSRKLRKLGHSMEFEKIKEYVPGDDVRTINWKATARSNNLMVNTYTDVRQQQIYCLIDKGRNMKLPFDGMTLLDYSINAALAVLNVALMKQDRAGIVTFSNKISDIVPADRRGDQLYRILEVLYKQQTDFLETDHEALWKLMRTRITQRSLVILFTNFETTSAMERQLPFLKQLAKNHLTCVVFFQNTLLEELHQQHPDTLEGVYIKTIAEQFALEKRLIVKELRRNGILSVLTTPQQLSINVINKYLELKARRMV